MKCCAAEPGPIRLPTKSWTPDLQRSARKSDVSDLRISYCAGTREHPSSGAASGERRPLPGLAALLHQVAEFFHIGRAGVIGDALIGRLHLGAERREIRAGHLHAGGFELVDLLGFAVSDQLAHEVARGGTLLAEHGLLVGREL